MRIPFNKPSILGNELQYIQDAIHRGHISGNGYYTRQSNFELEKIHGANSKSLLTHSCTGALEMAGILLNLKPGDEVILPSHTFVSTANSITMHGGIPVFVDCRPDTLNIDEEKIEAAVTSKTKACYVVHYAGIPCNMKKIMRIAAKHNFFVIEDNAQGLGSVIDDQIAGTFGSLSCLSFHETKNICSGEGGALIINDLSLVERAEVILEKGTNRSRFFRGEVDKYTWVDKGSSYVMSDLLAAFLLGQLEKWSDVCSERMKIWNTYYEAFADLDQRNLIRRPFVPKNVRHNGHMFYLLLPDIERKSKFISDMRALGIGVVSHYVPLHSAPGALCYARASGSLEVTNKISESLVRLPLWIGLEPFQKEIITIFRSWLIANCPGDSNKFLLNCKTSPSTYATTQFLDVEN